MGAGFNDIENKNNIEIKNISNSRLNGLSSWFGVHRLGSFFRNKRKRWVIKLFIFDFKKYVFMQNLLI